MAVFEVGDQSGLSLLEVLLVLAILSLIAGLSTFAHVPQNRTSVADVESFVAVAVANTMTSGMDSLLYAGPTSLRHGTREVAWEQSLGRTTRQEGSPPIVLYANGTSSERLELDAGEASIGLLTVPRW